MGRLVALVPVRPAFVVALEAAVGRVTRLARGAKLLVCVVVAVNYAVASFEFYFEILKVLFAVKID